jgi:excisionase family DNA binding protein
VPSKEFEVDPLYAAQALDVCRATIYRYLQSGDLPARRLGGRGRYRILVSDLERFAGIRLERPEPQRQAS